MANKNPLAYTGRVSGSTKVQGDVQFDGTQFTVVNGIVKLKGGGLAVDTLAGDSGTATPDAAGKATISGGSGITTSATSNTVTITGDDATTTTKGVASFPAAQFSTSSGAVTILDATDSVKGAASFDATQFTVTAGDVTINDATDSVKGAASFSATDFTVTSGAVSLAESIPSVASVTMTSAEVKALATTPIQLVAAPAAGSAIIFEGASLKLTYGGTNVFTESGDNLGIKYTDASGVQVSDTIEATGFIDQAASTYTSAVPVKDAIVAATGAEAQALVLDNLGSNFAGNAGDDNTLTVSVLYRIVTI